MAAKVESAEPQTNSYDPKRAEKIIKKIEAEFDGLKSEQMSYASKCRPYRERIGLAYEEAVQFGIPKKVLKEKVKERKLERQLECIGGDFEEDDKDAFEQLTQALGGYADTPLGKAAIDTASGRSSQPEEVQAKRPRGRPRKAPSAVETTSTADTVSAVDDVAGLDPAAVAEKDDPTYRRGFDAAVAGAGCLIPSELCGIYRDRWHAGWIAGRDHAAASQNAERITTGISPLH